MLDGEQSIKKCTYDNIPHDTIFLPETSKFQAFDQKLSMYLGAAPSPRTIKIMARSSASEKQAI